MTFTLEKIESLKERPWGLSYISKALTLLGFKEHKVGLNKTVWSHSMGMCCFLLDDYLNFVGFSIQGQIPKKSFFKNHKKGKSALDVSFKNDDGITLHKVEFDISTQEKFLDFVENNTLINKLLPFNEWQYQEFSYVGNSFNSITWSSFSIGDFTSLFENNLDSEKYELLSNENPEVKKAIFHLNQFFSKQWNVSKYEHRLFCKNMANFIRDKITWKECIEGFKASKTPVHPLMVGLFSTLHLDVDDENTDGAAYRARVEKLIKEMVEEYSVEDFKKILNNGILKASLFTYICLISNSPNLYFLNCLVDALKIVGKESAINSDLFDFRENTNNFKNFHPFFVDDDFKYLDKLLKNHLDLFLQHEEGKNHFLDFNKLIENNSSSDVIKLKKIIQSYLDEKTLLQLPLASRVKNKVRF